MSNIDYRSKYNKYRSKYNNLITQNGGAEAAAAVDGEQRDELAAAERAERAEHAEAARLAEEQRSDAVLAGIEAIDNQGPIQYNDQSLSYAHTGDAIMGDDIVHCNAGNYHCLVLANDLKERLNYLCKSHPRSWSKRNASVIKTFDQMEGGKLLASIKAMTDKQVIVIRDVLKFNEMMTDVEHTKKPHRDIQLYLEGRTKFFAIEPDQSEPPIAIVDIYSLVLLGRNTLYQASAIFHANAYITDVSHQLYRRKFEDQSYIPEQWYSDGSELFEQVSFENKLSLESGLLDQLFVTRYQAYYDPPDSFEAALAQACDTRWDGPRYGKGSGIFLPGDYVLIKNTGTFTNANQVGQIEYIVSEADTTLHDPYTYNPLRNIGSFSVRLIWSQMPKNATVREYQEDASTEHQTAAQVLLDREEIAEVRSEASVQTFKDAADQTRYDWNKVERQVAAEAAAEAMKAMPKSLNSRQIMFSLDRKVPKGNFGDLFGIFLRKDGDRLGIHTLKGASQNINAYRNKTLGGYDGELRSLDAVLTGINQHILTEEYRDFDNVPIEAIFERLSDRPINVVFTLPLSEQQAAQPSAESAGSRPRSSVRSAAHERTGSGLSHEAPPPPTDTGVSTDRRSRTTASTPSLHRSSVEAPTTSDGHQQLRDSTRQRSTQRYTAAARSVTAVSVADDEHPSGLEAQLRRQIEGLEQELMHKIKGLSDDIIALKKDLNMVDRETQNAVEELTQELQEMDTKISGKKSKKSSKRKAAGHAKSGRDKGGRGKDKGDKGGRGRSAERLAQESHSDSDSDASGAGRKGKGGKRKAAGHAKSGATSAAHAAIKDFRRDESHEEHPEALTESFEALRSYAKTRVSDRDQAEREQHRQKQQHEQTAATHAALLGRTHPEKHESEQHNRLEYMVRRDEEPSGIAPRLRDHPSREEELLAATARQHEEDHAAAAAKRAALLGERDLETQPLTRTGTAVDPRLAAASGLAPTPIEARRSKIRARPRRDAEHTDDVSAAQATRAELFGESRTRRSSGRQSRRSAARIGLGATSAGLGATSVGHNRLLRSAEPHEELELQQQQTARAHEEDQAAADATRAALLGESSSPSERY